MDDKIHHKTRDVQKMVRLMNQTEVMNILSLAPFTTDRIALLMQIINIDSPLEEPQLFVLLP